MAFERIGILSIGEMGYHWAKILTGRGVEVLTYAKDRSETTRKRPWSRILI
jgi:prephenate dehydrogenase